MSFISNEDNLMSNLNAPSYEDWFPPFVKKEEPKKLIRNMTVDICDTFKKRNPCYEYDTCYNPKRVLTKPSEQVKNDGYDNENSDYILYVHGILGGEDNKNQYLVLDVLGSGTFGQVVKCKNIETGELVGLKVIKNKPAYTKQSLIEVDILTKLNNVCDPEDEHNILRLKESFFHKNHLCLVFELLSVNLYELIKQNHFKGLSTNLVRLFSIQLLDTLSLIKLNQIIHCDLKPENILLKSLDSPSIKVIDFGSACYELQQTYTYIQSRFYRSPEVLLGLRYTTAIDMWSFGCIVAELYLGLPLFPGSSEYNQLTRITESIGNIPDEMIIGSKHGHRYFNRTTTYSDSNGNIFHFTLKDIKQYSKERKKSEKSSKRYFSTYNLDELVLNYPIARKDHLSKREKEKEKKIRIHLLDFLKKVLQLNPTERLTPQEAMKHPFISGIMKKDFKSEQVDEIISLGKKLLSEHEEKEETEQEDIPYMLTGVRRKSFANKESRSSTSVSPYSRKRYGSILSPLLSPPLETKNQDPLLLQDEASLLKAQLHNSSQLRHRSRQI